MQHQNLFKAGLAGAGGLLLAACGSGDPTPPPAPTGAQDGAHVHGVGSLSVNIEGSELTAAILAPGANFVGNDGTAMDEGAFRALLETETALIETPTVADCSLSSVSIDETTVGKDEHDHEAHADHHDDADEHDDHEEHDDHADEHDDHASHEDGDAHEDHDDHAGHTDINVTHTFECGNIDALDAVDVRLFENFGGFETLSAVVYNGDNEAFADLTDDTVTLSVPR